MVSREDEAAAAAPYILGMQLLRSIHARAKRIGPARMDALIALAFLVEAELEVLLLVDGAKYAGIAALLQVALAAALALRRISPPASLVLGLCAFVAFQPLGREINDNLIGGFFAILFLLFSFGLHEPDGRRIAAGMALG